MSVPSGLGIGAPRIALIMAGGTGGHVFPGLAVADVLKARGWNVRWLGNPNGIEARLVPQAKIPIDWVRVSAVRGKGLLATLLLPVRLLRAFAQAVEVLRRIRPAVVLGMGGYVAFPGGLMAWLLRRPLVLHEQNSIAGLTNRVLARLADRVLVAFPGAIGGAQCCGNPVRREFNELPAPAARYGARDGVLSVLVVGGSQGAQALNQAVPQAIALLPTDQRPRVMHQSGRNQAEPVTRAYAEAGAQAQVVEFIDDMAGAYGRADLVICRAGAMTVSELAAAGVASVLVPFPHAVDDHQTANARYLSERGAALLVAQSELSAQSLASMLAALNRAELMRMAERARSLAMPDAASAVADACEAVARPEVSR